MKLESLNHGLYVLHCHMTIFRFKMHAVQATCMVKLVYLMVIIGDIFKIDIYGDISRYF